MCIRDRGSTIVEAGDEVFFIAASQHIRAVMSELQRLEKPYKRIMLVGGGNIEMCIRDRCSTCLTVPEGTKPSLASSVDVKTR